MRHEVIDVDKATALLRPATTHPLDLLADYIETRGVPYHQGCPQQCMMALAGKLGLVPRRRRLFMFLHPDYQHYEGCGCPECLNYDEANMGGMSPGEMADLFQCQVPGVRASASKKQAVKFLRRRARELSAAMAAAA